MLDMTLLEERIGYNFEDKSLLKQALTHSSYASENGLTYNDNYERLEFIGDAYLDAVVGIILFRSMPDAHEGILSKIRAQIVCEESLADIARKINLGDFILLGKGECLNGGSNKESILADVLESVIGASVLESGYDAGADIINNLFKDKISEGLQGKLNKDFKSILQEYLQDKYRTIKINYVLVSESGPDHNKTFNVNVVVDDVVYGSGSGKSKSKAEQAAAHDVLSKGEI